MDAELQDVRDLRQVTSQVVFSSSTKREWRLPPKVAANVGKGRSSEADMKKGFLPLSPQAVHCVPTVRRDDTAPGQGGRNPRLPLTNIY